MIGSSSSSTITTVGLLVAPFIKCVPVLTRPQVVVFLKIKPHRAAGRPETYQGRLAGCGPVGFVICLPRCCVHSP